MVEEGFDALKVLEIAKGVERKGHAFYKEAAESVSDQNVKSLLFTLADDEVNHLRTIEEIRKGLENAFPDLPHQAHVVNLTTRFADLLFPEAPSGIRSGTSKLTEMQALERGIQLEKESIELYESAAEKEVNPGASNAFRRLLMQERMHLFILNQRYDVLKLRT